ncbi:MAG TPA: hypothetical protein VKI40_05970, partial [Terriglobales bacterium]|nr:hypothetical protein [Terriglobales bacterium]
WSHDQASGFAQLGGHDAIVASGTNAQVATAATVFFRDAVANRSSQRSRADESVSVMLTVAAQ